jgi:hypothetical protein
LHERLISALSISEAAGLFTLGLTGHTVDPADIAESANRIAATAERLGASPDDVQRALEYHEPLLALAAHLGF